MKGHQAEQPEVIDQAIEWLETLGNGKVDTEAFFRWLTESPRHVEVFIQTMTLEQRIAQIAPTHWAALERTANQQISESDEQTNVVSFSGTSWLPTSPSKRSWRAAAAAAAFAVAVVGTACWYLTRTWRWQDYTTIVGEQRTIQLQDGSVVELNTASHVQVHLSARTRDLRLLEGEAFFKVQHDPFRPFRVHTDNVTVQAVGTEFDVYRRTADTTVSVVEGRVQLATNPADPRSAATQETAATTTSHSAAISAGEQVDVGGDGRVKLHSNVNAAQVTAWQQRRLIFDEETLDHIASEFNRYNSRRFRIEDDEARGSRFSGIFDADDPESLALLLARDSRFHVERKKNEITIRTR
jgi:transmembrane sensor